MPDAVASLLHQDWRARLVWVTRSHLRAALALTVLAFCFFLPGQTSLQPMDRDEPRFAQASKQMIETGDFVDIRFQQEARHKKPVGIYWLQVAAVKAGAALGVPEPKVQIALYRLPSLIGAVLMVLATYWAALAFLSREGAFTAALMMVASVLLGVESHLAKTDAVLGALSTATLGFIARAYLSARAPGVIQTLSNNRLVIFWLIIGLAVLIKGPITPLIAALACLWLWARDRSVGWLKTLRPGMGLLIVGLVVLPWLTLILVKTGGSFLQDSVGKDMLAKVGSAQEKHWAPPGAYSGIFWLTFWPAAALVLLAIPTLWRERRDDGIALLAGWVIPFWLIVEAVPTKLPHYVLPLFPAIAILIVLAAERSGLSMNRALRVIAALLYALIPLAFLIATPAAFLLLEEGDLFARIPLYALPFLVLAFAFGLLGAREIWRGEAAMRAVLLGVFASLALTLGAYVFGLSKLEALRLSPRLAAAAKATGCASPSFATVGYREPSLVFLTDTNIELTDAAGAAAFMDKPGEGCRIAFIEAASEAGFKAALKGQAAPALVARVRGVNLNAAVDKQRKLRILDMGVYVRR
ncbi:MAG: glycosyltransferase family 39 protein [Proteobacteria bacterium]|nr:glycosyltransferase family 39 protein [Pseudomonadota bacterium]